MFFCWKMTETESNLNKNIFYLKFEPKTYQNRTNKYVLYVPRSTKILKPFSLIFGPFFGSNLKLVRLQNHIRNRSFFVVWFWYGFGMVLVWLRAEPKPYQTKNISVYNGIIRHFFKSNLSGNWLSQKPLWYNSCTTELF